MRGFTSNKRVANWVGRVGLGRVGLYVSISCLALTGIPLGIILAVRPNVWAQTSQGQVILGTLVNLFSGAVISALAAILVYVAFFYREREFLIHTVNFVVSSLPSATGRQLAGAIGEVQESYIRARPDLVRCRALERTDSQSVLDGLAAELSGDDAANLVVVPFQSLCESLRRLLVSEDASALRRWHRTSRFEASRTLALCVTYDADLATGIPSEQGVRCFSSPLIDVPAILRHVVEYDRSPRCIILSEGTAAPFWGPNDHLRVYIHDRVRELQAGRTWMARATEFMREGDGAPKTNGRRAVIVAAVAPSEGLLEKLARLVGDKDNPVVSIYVPPTWLRNWVISEGMSLVSHWERFLGAHRLRSVLPERVAEMAVGQSGEAGASFDIIQYFTRLAFEVAIAVQAQVTAEGGCEYGKVAAHLRRAVATVLAREDRSQSHIAQYPFRRLLADGDMYYECAVVEFGPDAGRTGLRVEWAGKAIAAPHRVEAPAGREGAVGSAIG